MFKQIDYNSKVLIATTIVKWKCESGEHLDWLKNKNKIKEFFPNCEFFVSIELDEDGISPFLDILNELEEVGGEYWTYSINDHIKKVGSQNRWIRIETGRNLIREYAQRETWSENDVDHTMDPKIKYDSILFIDSDMELTVEAIEGLLEVDSQVVGANVLGYDLVGEDIDGQPKLQYGGATIAAMLFNAPSYFTVPFHHNSYMKINDDFSVQDIVNKLVGPIVVRKDIVVSHKGRFVPVENRQIPDRAIVPKNSFNKLMGLKNDLNKPSA
jgi:hypothetical protein